MDKAPDIVLHLPRHLFSSKVLQSAHCKERGLKDAPCSLHFLHQKSHHIIPLYDDEHCNLSKTSQFEEPSSDNRCMNLMKNINYKNIMKNTLKPLEEHCLESVLFKRQLHNELIGIPQQEIRTSDDSDSMTSSGLSYEQLKQKFSQLHSDYHNLLGNHIMLLF